MVVVDLCGGLARVGAQDPADPLDDAAFVSDRRGEEQGVEGRAVEALPDVRPSGDDHQRRVTQNVGGLTNAVPWRCRSGQRPSGGYDRGHLAIAVAGHRHVVAHLFLSHLDTSNKS